MPVGTLGTVKGVTTSQLAATGAQMVLSNTYHLHLQPGEEIVAEAGLHGAVNNFSDRGAQMFLATGQPRHGGVAK